MCLANVASWWMRASPSQTISPLRSFLSLLSISIYTFLIDFGETTIHPHTPTRRSKQASNRERERERGRQNERVSWFQLCCCCCWFCGLDRSTESGIVKKHQHEHLPAFLVSLVEPCAPLFRLWNEPINPTLRVLNQLHSHHPVKKKKKKNHEQRHG